MPFGGRSLTLLGANVLFLALALALFLRRDLSLLLLPMFSLIFFWTDFRKDEEQYIIFLFLAAAVGLVLAAQAHGAQRAALAIELAGVVALCLGLVLHRGRLASERRRFHAEARELESRITDLEREERFYRDFQGTASAQIQLRRDLTAAAKSLGTTLEPEEVQRRLMGVVEKRFPGAKVHVLPGEPHDPLVEWAARSRASVLVKDASTDERLRGRVPADWRSAVMAPLTVLKRPYGFLRLEHPKPSAFAPEDVRTVDIFATLASLALENIQLIARVNDLATHDALTQLATHRAFQDRLQEEVLRAGRSQTPLSLLMVDIDHFKKYNDSFGHQAGDHLLRTAAGILTNHVRPVDFVARYGGEEFAVLLPGTVHSQAVELASRIRQRVSEEAFLFQGQRTRVTVSIGVSSFPQDAATTSQLVRVADERLYRAKNGGRDQVVG